MVYSKQCLALPHVKLDFFDFIQINLPLGFTSERKPHEIARVFATIDTIADEDN